MYNVHFFGFDDSLEAMVKPVEKAQRVTTTGSVCSDGYHVSNEEMQKLRTKVLELALNQFNLPLHNDGGAMFYERCNLLVNIANRFYTYITKGE